MLLEFLVETSLLSPTAGKDTPIASPPLLPCSPASWGHPEVLNSGSAFKGSQNRTVAVLKSGCAHGCASHEYDTHLKVETRSRMSSQPKGTISLISQR